MELKKIDNTNIYEFEISGKITEEELDNLYLAFTQFKENNEKVNLLGKIDQIPSFDVFQNLSKIVKMKLASLKVIHKYAILTDRELIENLAPIGNFFSPSIQVKTFESDEREDAINWLNEKNVNEYDPDEYLTGIDIKKIDASTYEIDIAGSEIDHASMAALHQILDQHPEGENIKLLMKLSRFPSIDSFSTLIEGIKLDFRFFGRLSKYAIVSDLKWIEGYSKIGDYMTPGIEVKAFSTDELSEAREWLGKDD